jgi:hypothetical protein
MVPRLDAAAQGQSIAAPGGEQPRASYALDRIQAEASSWRANATLANGAERVACLAHAAECERLVLLSLTLPIIVDRTHNMRPHHLVAQPIHAGAKPRHTYHPADYCAYAPGFVERRRRKIA